MIISQEKELSFGNVQDIYTSSRNNVKNNNLHNHLNLIIILQ